MDYVHVLYVLFQRYTLEPVSLKSSRATAVITTCFKFINSTDSATRSGSFKSSSLGNPVLTAQKRHALVHTVT